MTKNIHSARWRNWLICLIFLALAIYLCYFHISPVPHPFFHRTVNRGSTPFSGTWQQTFEVAQPQPRFNVRIYSKGSTPQLSIDLESKTGIQLLRNFRIRTKHVRFSCGKDLPAGPYTIRVREENVTGKYTIDISAKAAFSSWQKFLVLLCFLFVVSGVLYTWQKHRSHTGKPAPALATVHILFLSSSLVAFALFFYLLLHEGGHALASIWFGNFDLSRSDFFGLHGAPHSGVKPGIQLEDWQKAVQSITGPILPTLVGYVLFMVWRSRWGTRIRIQKTTVDIFWSFAIFTLLFAHLGMLLPMTGLHMDGDYNGFVSNVPFARWQANALLLLFASINAYMLYRTIPHLVKLRRKFVSEVAQESRPSNTRQSTPVDA